MGKPVMVNNYIAMIADEGSFHETMQEPCVYDPLTWTTFSVYRDKMAAAQTATGLQCGVIWGECTIEKHPAVIVVNQLTFMGGSLAIAETDAIVAAFETGVKKQLPVIWCVASGGCRIYEGIFSLHCIPQIIQARNALGKAHMPLITVAMDPLYGGTNICSTLSDIIIGEKNAHIGFTGKNVIKSFEKFPLPSDFQTSDYALVHGHIDEVVELDTIKSRLARILGIFSAPETATAPSQGSLLTHTSNHVESWSAVQSARNNPTKIDVLFGTLFDVFYELHGDRISADDAAIITGIGRIGNRTFAVAGHNNAIGSSMGVSFSHYFSSAHPSGHRKALRLVRLAERLNLPIATFIDTPGAIPDVKAEAEGQAGSIGELIAAMLDVPVPTIGFIVGEGGSAGALPFATVDKLVMSEHAVYSVISPEGVAAILAQDASRAPEASEALKLTASDMLGFGIADYIMPREDNAAHEVASIKAAIRYCLQEIESNGLTGKRRLRTYQQFLRK